jgi:two-component system phosphate regulon response regulator PhoB
VRKERVDGKPRVIILSARKDEEDRVKGFELGADDYVVKPFSPKELVYRIRTTLGREGGGVDTARLLKVGPIQLDEETHEVHVGGRSVHLTLTEFRLLADMMRNEGRVRTRETLMSRVWDYDSQAMSRTVDTHIRRLRAKLGDAASWLRTVRGVGYRIKDPSGD